MIDQGKRLRVRVSERASPRSAPARIDDLSRLWAINVVSFPLLRVLLLAVIFTYLVLTPEQCAWPAWLSLRSYMLLGATYALVSWALLLVYYRPTQRVDLGLVFLILDLPIWSLAIYASGSAESWLVLMLIVRTADQARVSKRRVVLFAHLTTLAFVTVAVASGATDDVGATALRAAGLYAMSFAIALASNAFGPRDTSKCACSHVAAPDVAILRTQRSRARTGKPTSS